MIVGLANPQVIVSASRDIEKLFIFKTYLEQLDQPEDTNAAEINMEDKPQQILNIDDTHLVVIFQESTRRLRLKINWDLSSEEMEDIKRSNITTRDIAIDYLIESRSIFKTPTIGFFSADHWLQLIDSSKNEVLTTVKIQDWDPKIQTDSTLTMLLLPPNSKSAVFAKRGSGSILVQNYQNLTQSRIIQTGFDQLQSVLLGRQEKIIFTVDKSINILAEFILPEIGCPITEDEIICSQLFTEENVECKKPNMIWNSKLRRCICRSGFYLDVGSGNCSPCKCIYYGQVCRDTATDCGTKAAY